MSKNNVITLPTAATKLKITVVQIPVAVICGNVPSEITVTLKHFFDGDENDIIAVFEDGSDVALTETGTQFSISNLGEFVLDKPVTATAIDVVVTGKATVEIL